MATHRTNNGTQQLAHPHHPPIQRRTPNLDAGFALQHHRLPVQPQVVAVLRHHGMDRYSIARQTLFDDAFGQRSRASASTSSRVAQSRGGSCGQQACARRIRMTKFHRRYWLHES